MKVNTNTVFRLEPEFYNANSMNYKNVVKGEKAIVFSQYGTSKELNEIGLGYPILRLNEFNYSFISRPSKYCNLLDSETYHSLKLKKDDVLICRTNGNPKLVGKSALVPTDYDYAFASYLFRVRPDRNIINSATLVAYLNSKFGRMEIEKYAMVGNQANFSPAKFREIAIPILPQSIQQEVECSTYQAFELLEQSKNIYASAEAYLLECLGMTNFVANPKSYNVKSLKDAFFDSETVISRCKEQFKAVYCSKKLSNSLLLSGRLDAEYYQPKYDFLFNKLKKFKTKTIRQIATLSKSIEPGSDAYKKEGIPFIRVADISEFGLSETSIFLDNSIFKNVIRPQKDTILLSKDGSVGIAYKVDEYLNVITSGAILHLKIIDSEVLPDYLTLVLNSIIVKLQAERDSGGSIIQHWKPTEINNVVVPILPISIQKQISDQVRLCFNLRKESQTILRQVGRTIELAIDNLEV